MFTLSDASKDTKEFLKWAGIFILGLIALFLLVKILLYVKELIFPTPPPKPTIAFGKLQPQVFPQNAINKKLTYSLNTLTGTLPNLLSQTKVYRMQNIQPDLLGVSNAQQKVNSVGFSGNPQEVSNKLFQWASNPNLTGIPRTISVNTVNYDFTIYSSYINDNSVLSAQNIPSLSGATDIATKLITDMNLMPTDVDVNKTNTNLFSIKNNSLTHATSLSDAQIIEVDFHQSDINNLHIYYENPFSSSMSILIAGGDSQGQVVSANFVYQAVSNQSSTYPLITTTVAFDELKSGNAYIAAYSGNSAKISITNVFLSYYIGNSVQDFLMPIFVFQGNNGFYAYVPAVTGEWIQN